MLSLQAPSNFETVFYSGIQRFSSVQWDCAMPETTDTYMPFQMLFFLRYHKNIRHSEIA